MVPAQHTYQIALKLLKEAVDTNKKSWKYNFDNARAVISELKAKQKAVYDTWAAKQSSLFPDTIDPYEECPILADYEKAIQDWEDFHQDLLSYEWIYDPDCDDGHSSEIHEQYKLHPENFSNLDAQVVAMVVEGSLPDFYQFSPEQPCALLLYEAS